MLLSCITWILGAELRCNPSLFHPNQNNKARKKLHLLGTTISGPISEPAQMLKYRHNPILEREGRRQTSCRAGEGSSVIPISRSRTQMLQHTSCSIFFRYAQGTTSDQQAQCLTHQSNEKALGSRVREKGFYIQGLCKHMLTLQQLSGAL